MMKQTYYVVAFRPSLQAEEEGGIVAGWNWYWLSASARRRAIMLMQAVNTEVLYFPVSVEFSEDNDVISSRIEQTGLLDRW